MKETKYVQVTLVKPSVKPDREALKQAGRQTYRQTEKDWYRALVSRPARSICIYCKTIISNCAVKLILTVLFNCKNNSLYCKTISFSCIVKLNFNYNF